MADAVELRDATADGVSQGYAEAQINARVWKVTGGRLRRPWATSPETKGLTGGPLEAALRGIALQFPGNVSI